MRRFLHDNGLSIALFALFLVSLAGQMLAGHAAQVEDRREHGRPPGTLVEYVGSGDFLEAIAENRESEFLQMAFYILLTAFLVQKGSPESRKPDGGEPTDVVPAPGDAPADAPRPVRRGGLALALYERSLSIVLFLLFFVSFGLHAVAGAAAYNEEQLLHGGRTVSALGYLATPRFWFESFQNWQSEFFSVGLLVVLSVFLRQRGSPQSKPVAAPHGETGR